MKRPTYTVYIKDTSGLFSQVGWVIFWEGKSYPKLRKVCQKWLLNEPTVKIQTENAKSIRVI